MFSSWYFLFRSSQRPEHPWFISSEKAASRENSRELPQRAASRKLHPKSCSRVPPARKEEEESPGFSSVSWGEASCGCLQEEHPGEGRRTVAVFREAAKSLNYLFSNSLSISYPNFSGFSDPLFLVKTYVFLFIASFL